MSEHSSPHASLFSVRALWPLAVLVLAAGLVFAMGWHRLLSFETLVRHRILLSAYVDDHALIAVAAYVGVYMAAVALSVPGATILTIGGGALFGTVTGSAATAFAATFGAGAVFLVAKSALGTYLKRRAGSGLQKFAEGFRKDAFSYLLFLRLVPIFPFWLVNIAPALLGVKFRTFITATALGIIPGTLAFSFFGAGLDDVIERQADAYRACVAASRSDCAVSFDPSSLLSPKLIAAFVALGLAALIPVALKRLRANEKS